MKGPSTTFIYTCLLAVLILFSVSLFWRNTLWLTLILIIISVAMIAIGKSKEDLFLYIICFFIGPLSEAIAISFGIWAYTSPDIIGVPLWLTFVWGNAGVFIKRLYLEIENLYGDKRNK